MRKLARGSEPLVLVAAATPRGAGEVDRRVFQERARRARASGLDGVLVGGSTGRGDGLAPDELLALLRSVGEASSELLRVAGFGARPVELDAIRRRLEGLAGHAEAALVPPPDDDERVVGFFEKLVSESPLPLLVYQPPQRRERPFTAGLAAELASMPGLLGVKDSTGQEDLLSSWRSGREDFLLLLGSLRLLSRRAADVDGAILAMANLHPEDCVALARGKTSTMAAMEATQQALEQGGLRELERRLGAAEDQASSG